ncbi:hypothetical protein [Formosa algae]|uniref:hypothetical protein n=1 Tax=Formosa algae TaxID=225843 RepID=UPI000CCE5819|nr:hypothetical protein [Formosa algae]PNW26592.1 hypothetical protein BKP44_16420 [Formosa algae]
MKHIIVYIVCFLTLQLGFANPILIEIEPPTISKDFGNNQLTPLHLNRDYLSEQSRQFINQEISFIRVFEEATKFWQSDKTRAKRWEPRVKKYFNENTYSTFKDVQTSKTLEPEVLQTDLDKMVDFITIESINEYSKELALLMFLWFFISIAALYKKGNFVMSDIVLTSLICIWFSVKNQMIKDNMEDLLVFKNNRLTEFVSGVHKQQNHQKTPHFSKYLNAIFFLE